MSSYKPLYLLHDIIPFDALRDIIKCIHGVTHLRTVVTNYKGELYDGFKVKGEYDACKKIRVGELGKMCDRSDAFAGLEAARAGKPLTYLCHRGAAEAVSPIIVNGQYFGSILTGQTILPDHEMEQLEQFVKPDMTLTPAQQKACDELPGKLVSCTLARLQAAAQLLFIVTNYIAEIGYRAITQRRFDEYEFNLLKERSINAELERSIAAVKLNNMQTQMRPHFLFNTLNIINQTAILEGAVETPKLIRALSDIMRRTIGLNDRPGILGDEINQIKNYLYIAQTSLQDRLKLEWDVDESCFDAAFPPFTIQPLVENAITHGLENKVEGGSLSFSVKKEQEILNIDIDDTGCGIDAETLHEILLLKTPEFSMDDSNSIGIHNSMRILSNFFGPVFSWSVDSSPDKGTRFHLRTPYRPIIVASDE